MPAELEAFGARGHFLIQFVDLSSLVTSPSLASQSRKLMSQFKNPLIRTIFF